MNFFLRVSALFLIIAVSSGCAVKVRAGDNLSQRDYDSVFGGIDIDKGAKVGNLSSVNGGIDIGSNAVVKSATTVNGGIEIGSQVQINSAETVNGGIEAGQGLLVSKNLETVNGGVVLQKGSSIGGSIVTVNGDIDLSGVSVKVNIETVNGDITLEDKTVINGDLIYQKSGGYFSGWGSEKPVLVIDSSSEVSGTIHLYRPVELKISEQAKVSDIKYHYPRK